MNDQEVVLEISRIAPRLLALRSKVRRGERLSMAEQREATEFAARVQGLQGYARAAGRQASEFRSFLRGSGHERIFDQRAAGEGTGSAGGYWVPTGWSNSVIRYAREYSALLEAFEQWDDDTSGGEPFNRAAYSEFSAAATDTENTAFTYGPEPTFAQQAWPLCPTYAGSYRVSNQLVQDAFQALNVPVAGGSQTLDALVSSALGESIGRAVAPVAQAALYSTINGVGATSGGAGGYLALGTATPINFATGSATTELAANTINLDTVGAMIESLDEAYIENAAFYMSRIQWGGIIRQVSSSDKKTQISPSDDNRSLFGFPVVLTSQTTAATASTVSGPVFGDLGAAMTLRTVAGSFGMMRSTEKYAEWLQTYFNAWARLDVAARDARAVVGVKYATS